MQKHDHYVRVEPTEQTPARALVYKVTSPENMLRDDWSVAHRGAELQTIIENFKAAQNAAVLTDRTGQAKPKLVLDMSDIQFIGSTDIGMLVKTYGDIKNMGELHIVGANGVVAEKFSLTMLDKLMYVTPDSLDQWMEKQNSQQAVR